MHAAVVMNISERENGSALTPSEAALFLTDVILASTSVVGIFANILVCYVVLRTASLRTFMNANIVSLSIANLTFCVFLVPVRLAIYNFDPNGYEWISMMCKVDDFLKTCCDCVQLFMVTSTSFERYQAIAYPFKKTGRELRAGLTIAFSWSVSLFLGVLAAIYLGDSAMYYPCFTQTDMIFKRPWGEKEIVLNFPLGIICIFAVILFYGLILRTLVKHNLTMTKKFGLFKNKNKVHPNLDKTAEKHPSKEELRYSVLAVNQQEVKWPGESPCNGVKDKGSIKPEKGVNDKRSQKPEEGVKDDGSIKPEHGVTVLSEKGIGDIKEQVLENTNQRISGTEQLSGNTDCAFEHFELSNCQEEHVHNKVLTRTSAPTSPKPYNKADLRTSQSLPDFTKERQLSLFQSNESLKEHNLMANSPHVPAKEKCLNASKEIFQISCYQSIIPNPLQNSEVNTTSNDANNYLLPPVKGPDDKVQENNIHNRSIESNKDLLANEQEPFTRIADVHSFTTKIDDFTTNLPSTSVEILEHSHCEDKKQTVNSVLVVEMDGTAHKEKMSSEQVVGAVCVMNPKNKEQGRRRVELRAAKRISIFIGTFIFLWLPLPVTVIYLSRTQSMLSVHVDIVMIVAALSSSTAALNPILTGILNKQIKSTLNCTFRKWRGYLKIKR